MTHKTRLIIELLVLFAAIPIALALKPLFPISALLLLAGLVYAAFISKDIFLEGQWRDLLRCIKRAASLPNLRDFKPQMIRVGILLVLFILISGFYMAMHRPNDFLHPINNNISLWLFITGMYALMSVLPQEFLYRSFFFKRYGSLFSNQWSLILTNAALFSLAHLMFYNALVMALTFAGGFLFAYTYHQTRSYWLVSIEHFIYGWWLYSVGMGEMLAFPTG